MIAISLQLYWSTSVLAKGVTIYKSVKVIRVSLQVLVIGFLCALLFWLTGDKIITLAFLLPPYYKVLTFAAILVTLGLEIYPSPTLLTKGIKIYKTVKVIRISLLLLLTGILCYLFFAWTGDKIISILLLFTSEYKQLTIVAIISFFVLIYVSSKNEYENLNVFGSVLLIMWICVFVISTGIDLGIHFHLFEMSERLYVYLTRVLPGGYKILPAIILASWVINFFALLYVTCRRISNILIDHITKKIRNSYQEKIIEFINEEPNDNEFSPENQLYFKKVKRLFFTRQIFSEELLRMHELVYGGLREQINQLFYSLLFKKDALHYLHSYHWFYKIKGLRIYAELGDKSEIAYIQKTLKSNNPILRFEAQLALSRLNEEDKPLDYLKDLEQTLTVWEQLNLIHFYSQHKKTVGDLTGLLGSKNTSVICFALQCIRKFNEVEYRNQIIELTRHPNWDVQNAAFQALTLFDGSEIGFYILSRYHHAQSLSTQIHIIRSLGRIGDLETVPFLKEQISIVEKDEVCIELFRALIQIDAQQARDMANSNYFKYKRLYEHVTETSK